MTRDSAYFRQRAAEARASCANGRGEEAAVAGELALAYAALARRRSAADAKAEAVPMPAVDLV